MKRFCYSSVIALVFMITSFESASAQDNDDTLAADGLPMEAGREPGIFLPQIASFFVPGLDQFWEGQNLAGTAYLGAAVGAYALGFDHSYRARLRLSPDELADESELGIGSKDPNIRPMNWAFQTAQVAGGLSAYDSFRTATKYRKKLGQFDFIEKQDSVIDVLQAPFNFKFLARSTTWIPLAIGGAISVLSLSSSDAAHIPEVLKPQDYLYSGLFSYNAGTHEEAMFRGWIMPMFRHYTGSDLWSNVIGSSLFAVAHLSTVSVPLPQLLLGFHLGRVTQKNHWSIAESVFIHAWWDVFAFLTVYQTPKEDLKGLQRTMPFLLPPLEWNF
jgi:membrane protease YdiL (CAAX protease family)